MKKYIFFSIYAAGMMLVLAACQKVLDTQPYDKISGDVVWSNKANAETFIFGTYGIMNAYNSGASSDGRTTNLLAMDGTYNGSASIFTETTDRNSNIGGFNNFGAIRRCNLIITNVAASAGIADQDKKALVAEGKFLRAMSYYNIARNVGRIVWIDKVLTPEDELKLPSTANPTESYNYIIKDLEEAIPDLSATKVPGRANKYVAAAFLSEICLQAAAYKNYPNPPSPGNDPLVDKAITYANMVISQGGYSLVGDYGGMFNESNPTSSETIFGVYRKALNTNCDGTPMQTMMANFSNDQINNYGGSPNLSTNFRIFEAWIEHAPTYNLSKDYLVIDKADPNKALEWDKTSQYLAAVDESATVPTGDLQKQNNESYVKTGVIRSGRTETMWNLMNENRDARFAQTIITDSSKFYGETLTTCIKGNSTRWMKINGFAYYVSMTNMYWRKLMYNNVSPRIYVGVPTDYHYVDMRLGRVYLNLAEAYLLKGDVANALINLNKTRVTHGKLPPSTASTLAEAWKDYKRERRVDLVLENDYYYSLLRWGRYGGAANNGISPGGTIPELTELPMVMDISKNRKSFSIVSGPFYASNNTRVFNEQRRYLFPIPQGLIDNNSNFGPQNPGW